MEEFNVGDVVKLKSDGPEMTIEHIRNGEIWCVYFDDNRAIRESFVLGVLKKVEPKIRQNPSKYLG